MAQTLVDLGGVDAGDVLLLQGRNLAAVHAAFAATQSRIAAWHQNAELRVVLIFYFSGHSDGEALEIGRERLPFSELRRWLGATLAEVRLVIVDSCQAGALLAAKGGRPGPGFQIRLSDDLASSGEALLTSSAADELALESKEIRGSFFTHHLVSGLRGAADSSGDGVVTLAEAYQYAFAHTVAATAGTLIGPQHPAYDYRLSGQGELVLATLARAGAGLLLPGGFERIVITRLRLDQVIAEVPAALAAVHVMVPPGPYAIAAWKRGRLYTARVTVGDGETRRVDAGELAGRGTPETQAKGGAATPTIAAARPLPTQRDVRLVVAAGVQGGASPGVSAAPSLRLGVRSATPSGWSAAADLAANRGAGFWETTAIAYAGYRLGFLRGVFGGFVGLEVGAGVASQKLDGGPSATSATVVGAPWLGATVRLSPRVLLTLESHVPLGWVRRDGGNALALYPAGWVGLVLRP